MTERVRIIMMELFSCNSRGGKVGKLFKDYKELHKLFSLAGLWYRGYWIKIANISFKIFAFIVI